MFNLFKKIQTIQPAKVEPQPIIDPIRKKKLKEVKDDIQDTLIMLAIVKALK